MTSTRKSSCFFPWMLYLSCLICFIFGKSMPTFSHNRQFLLETINPSISYNFWYCRFFFCCCVWHNCDYWKPPISLHSRRSHTIILMEWVRWRKTRLFVDRMSYGIPVHNDELRSYTCCFYCCCIFVYVEKSYL